MDVPKITGKKTKTDHGQWSAQKKTVRCDKCGKKFLTVASQRQHYLTSHAALLEEKGQNQLDYPEIKSMQNCLKQPSPGHIQQIVAYLSHPVEAIRHGAVDVIEKLLLAFPSERKKKVFQKAFLNSLTLLHKQELAETYPHSGPHVAYVAQISKLITLLQTSST